MQALLALTRANIRSYTRDRAAVFWTLAFPLIFIFLFGLIFQGGGSSDINLGWVDQDGSPSSGQLRSALAGTSAQPRSCASWRRLTGAWPAGSAASWKV